MIHKFHILIISFTAAIGYGYFLWMALGEAHYLPYSLVWSLWGTIPGVLLGGCTIVLSSLSVILWKKALAGMKRRTPIERLVILLLILSIIWGSWFTSPIWLPVHMSDYILCAQQKESHAKAEKWLARQQRLFICQQQLPLEKICEVHQEKMIPDSVWVAYGLHRDSKEIRDVKAMMFPNSNKIYYGGCLLMWWEPYKCVLYCPRCREDEEQIMKVFGSKIAWIE
jgi:hypothetical protein